MNTKTTKLVPLTVAVAACLFAAGCHDNVRDADDTGMQPSSSMPTDTSGDASSTTTTTNTTTNGDNTGTNSTTTTTTDSSQDPNNPPTSP